MHSWHVLAQLLADAPAPPDPTAVLPGKASFLLDQITSMFGRVWPALVPFLLLRFGMGLVEWYVDYRRRRSQPEQLTLF
jgi:hypothetical protein